MAEAIAVRSVWSLVASVVVLGGLVGYIYFVDSKTEPNAPEVKEKVWGGTWPPPTWRRCEIKLADGRDRQGAEDRRHLAARRAGEGACRRYGDDLDHQQSRRRSRSSASSMPTPATSSSTGSIRRASRWPSAARDRRIRDESSSARRRQPAETCTRASRREARLPGVVLSRLDVQQDAVCAARQSHPQDRSAEGGRPRADRGRDKRSAGQEGQRLDGREAARGAC